MTGVLHALAGQGGGGERFTVTIGNTAASYGYNDGVPMGSISPAASYRGVTIRVVANDTTGNTFTFTLDGDRAQSFFSGIEIQATDGSIHLFNTPSTSFFTGGSTTIWQWTAATDIWTATSPATRSIRVL